MRYDDQNTPISKHQKHWPPQLTSSFYYTQINIPNHKKGATNHHLFSLQKRLKRGQTGLGRNYDTLEEEEKKKNHYLIKPKGEL